MNTKVALVLLLCVAGIALATATANPSNETDLPTNNVEAAWPSCTSGAGPWCMDVQCDGKTDPSLETCNCGYSACKCKVDGCGPPSDPVDPTKPTRTCGSIDNLCISYKCGVDSQDCKCVADKCRCNLPDCVSTSDVAKEVERDVENDMDGDNEAVSTPTKSTWEACTNESSGRPWCVRTWCQNLTGQAQCDCGYKSCACEFEGCTGPSKPIDPHTDRVCQPGADTLCLSYQCGVDTTDCKCAQLKCACKLPTCV